MDAQAAKATQALLRAKFPEVGPGENEETGEFVYNYPAWWRTDRKGPGYKLLAKLRQCRRVLRRGPTPVILEPLGDADKPDDLGLTDDELEALGL